MSETMTDADRGIARPIRLRKLVEVLEAALARSPDAYDPKVEVWLDEYRMVHIVRVGQFGVVPDVTFGLGEIEMDLSPTGAPSVRDALKEMVATYGDFAPGQPFEFPDDHPVARARAALDATTNHTPKSAVTEPPATLSGGEPMKGAE